MMRRGVLERCLLGAIGYPVLLDRDLLSPSYQGESRQLRTDRESDDQCFDLS